MDSRAFRQAAATLYYCSRFVWNRKKLPILLHAKGKEVFQSCWLSILATENNKTERTKTVEEIKEKENCGAMIISALQEISSPYDSKVLFLQQTFFFLGSFLLKRSSDLNYDPNNMLPRTALEKANWRQLLPTKSHVKPRRLPYISLWFYCSDFFYHFLAKSTALVSYFSTNPALSNFYFAQWRPRPKLKIIQPNFPFTVLLELT